MTPSPHPLESATGTGDNVVVWLVLGLVALYVMSMLAKEVLEQLRPTIGLLFAAAILGVLVANMASNI